MSRRQGGEQIAAPAPSAPVMTAASLDQYGKAEALATEWAEREAEQRAAMQAQLHPVVGAAQGARQIVPMVAFPDEASDSDAIVDADGNSLVNPGWIGRWVRMFDHEGRESQSRARDFERYGYEFVNDPATGQPMRKDHRVAMQATPEAAARRTYRKSPYGTNKTPLESAHETAESMNRQADREIVRVTESVHKREREERTVSEI